MVSTPNTLFWDPLRSIPFPVLITGVGSSKTATLYIAVDGSAPTLNNTPARRPVMACRSAALSGLRTVILFIGKPARGLTLNRAFSA